MAELPTKSLSVAAKWQEIERKAIKETNGLCWRWP